MEECKKCLAKSGHGVFLDGNGICSYCRISNNYSSLIYKIGKQDTVLRERLSLLRGEGKYDCLVGLSGGKDSSYIILKLKASNRARVLAYTCDNGFLNSYAKKNIQAIAEDLGVDHIWVRPGRQILRTVYANNLAMEGWPCSACFHLLEASAWKIAFENRIPYIVSGRTPEQILRKPDNSIFEYISANFANHDKGKVRQIALSTLQRIIDMKKWLIPDQGKCPSAEYCSFYSNLAATPEDFAPELLYFFVYENHNESHIMNVLQKETNWQPPENTGPLSHADCEAHDAAGYLYYHNYGTTFLNLEVSAAIRLGKLTKEEGQKLINSEINTVRQYPRHSVQSVSRVSGRTVIDIRTLPLRIKTKRFFKNIVCKHRMPKTTL